MTARRSTCSVSLVVEIDVEQGAEVLSAVRAALGDKLRFVQGEVLIVTTPIEDAGEPAPLRWATREELAEQAEAEASYERHLAEREAAHESYLDSIVWGSY